MTKTNSQSQSGVMMAMVVILFSACVMLLTAMLQYVTTISGFSNEVVYRQIAQTAAKSALEEGKERFDGNIRFDQLDVDNNGTTDNDTNSNGVADTLDEKTLFTNTMYRVTYQLSIKAGGTSADGRSKAAIGTGRIYLPAGATTARYTRTLNSEVIRSTIEQSNPSDFSPMAWYDAKCGPVTSTEPGCELPTVLRTGTANVAANPISVREENKTSGAHCGGSPTVGGSSDNVLSMTKVGECGAGVEQRVGLLFNAGAGLPKGSAIQAADVQFTSAGIVDNVDVTLRIRGILVGNQAAFTSGNSSQMTPMTTAYVDWTPTTWPATTQSNTKQRTPNISAVLQEVINQATWATGNNIGLVIECVSTNCNGTRHALTLPMTLNITYTGYTQAVANDNVQVWRDRSGNGFHLTALDVASQPVRSVVSQSPSGSPPDGEPMIRFNGGSAAYAATKGMSATVPASSGRAANSYTTFAILKMRSSTDATSISSLAAGNGHILSFRGTGTSNVTIAPLWRHGATNFHTGDSSTGGTGTAFCQGQSVPGPSVQEYQCRFPSSIGTVSGSPWSIYSNRSELYSVEALFRMHGDNSNPQIYTNTVLNFNAPYTIALGYNPANSTKGASFEVSELIVYDRTLSCPQMEAVEKYLAVKWGYENPGLGSNSRYVSNGCRENNLPAY